MHAVNDEHAHLHELIRDATRRGVRDAIDEFLHDDSEFGRLSERLYGKLSEHTTNGITQWVGKRILTIMLAAALSGSVAWAVLTGRIK